MTYNESVEDVAASVQSKFPAWVTVYFDPADLHVTRRYHLKLVVPVKQRNNQFIQPLNAMTKKTIPQAYINCEGAHPYRRFETARIEPN